MSFGDGRPGIAAVVMIKSDCLICWVSTRVNFGFFRCSQFAGIAALAPRIHASLDECGAERQSLLLGFRAHVVAFDDGTETVSGGDGLQTGDTEAHDQNFGRADRAGSRC